MKTTLWLALLGILSQLETSAQLINYPLRVQRQRWLSQIATNAYPVAYRFGTQVVGAGLNTGEDRTPQTTNQLMLTTVYGVTALTFGTNFPAWSDSLTNLSGGLAQFNQSYPTGSYTMNYNGTLGIPFTRNLNLSLAKDFPVIDPVFTNLNPTVPLQTNMTFAWPVFSADSADYARFIMLEGKIGDNYTNLLQTIISNGVDSVTNDLKILSRQLKLAPSQNQITVTNINPQLDHLTLLEFARFSPNGNDTLYDVTSVAANATFFFSLRVLVNPVDQVVALGDVALFTALAVGAQPLSYQWRHTGTNLPGATNLYHLISNVRPADVGEYVLTITNVTGAATSAPAMLILTNYAPEIVLDFCRLTNGRNFAFQIRGDGTAFVVLACLDLKTQQWSNIATVSAPNGITSFEDTNAPAYPRRFYRARLP